MKLPIKFTILWGLPGCGKSTYAKTLDNKKSHIVDCDKLWKKYPDKIYEAIVNNINDYNYNRNHFIIDGLITNNKTADSFMSALAKFDATFEIVWWSPDRENCTHNDRGRRSIPSTITINNIQFEEPNQKLIDDWKCKVIRKETIRKPDWQAWAQENDLGSDKFLKSESWSLGGTAGSCYGNELSTIYPSTPPASFKYFDELLEKICPNITFLQYKKLYNETVSTETTQESDWYGGSTQHANYTCDLSKLYQMLRELNVIP